MKTQSKLLSRYFPTTPVGRVEWIGLRPERQAPMIEVHQTQAIEARGLDGDRSAKNANNSSRQVTLITTEDIQALASTLGRGTVSPEILRRNIVVSGINLHSLRYQTIEIGDALLEIGAHCHPCSRMEKALGEGGFLAMYMRGGYCCKVLRSGAISVGDAVTYLPTDTTPSTQQPLF